MFRRTKHSKAPEMKRTKWPKKSQLRRDIARVIGVRDHRVLFFDNPAYVEGTILSKRGVSDVLIVRVHFPYNPENPRTFTLMRMDDRFVSAQVYTAKEAMVLGYDKSRQINSDELAEIQAHCIDGGFLSNKPKKKRGEGNPAFCNNGLGIPLSKCKIRKGESPLDSGTRVHMKGRYVAGLFVICPVCNKPGTKIVFNKKDRCYVTARHKPYVKRTRGAKKQEFKRTKTTNKMRRTK